MFSLGAPAICKRCAESPLLCNLYLKDLAFSFDNVLSDPFVLPNGTRLNSLFYADDSIILSRLKLGLQNCLTYFFRIATLGCLE